MLVHAPAVAVEHLDLVDAAQIHAGVAAGQHAHIVGELEVEEVAPLRDDVRAAAVGLAVGLALDAIGEHTVLHRPAEVVALVHRLPAVDAVGKKVDRLAEDCL